MAALEQTASPPKDTVAFAFLIAMILVAAVMFGAGASGVASGAVQDMLRTAGFGANAEIRAELGLHRAEIADIGASLDRMIGEAAALDARTGDLARGDAAQADRLARLDAEVAMLKAKFHALLPDDPLESLANPSLPAWPARPGNPVNTDREESIVRSGLATTPIESAQSENALGFADCGPQPRGVSR